MKKSINHQTVVGSAVLPSRGMALNLTELPRTLFAL